MDEAYQIADRHALVLDERGRVQSGLPELLRAQCLALPHYSEWDGDPAELMAQRATDRKAPSPVAGEG